jgi:hypothetical protein
MRYVRTCSMESRGRVLSIVKFWSITATELISRWTASSALSYNTSCYYMLLLLAWRTRGLVNSLNETAGYDVTDRIGLNITQQGRTGQDRTGQDRTGQDRTGQDRAGQDRTGRDVTEHHTTGQGGAEHRIKLHLSSLHCLQIHHVKAAGALPVAHDAARMHVHRPYSTVQYSTVQYSTVRYSTVQCSAVQCSAVQYSINRKGQGRV